ncbi:MAG TPA: PDZ domain-containing protein [Acidobacteriaceae bacterium]|jgi:S1-C subfamily serine protease
MKIGWNYGLILLTMATPHAFASGSTAEQGAATLFFVSGSNPTSARNPPGYLGVSLRDVTPDLSASLKLKEARGAEIVLVDHDAPAGKAGLREHDVVLQMNGQSIEGQDQLRHLLHDSPPGKTITLTISRDGQQLTVSAQMAASQEEVERRAWEQHLTVPEPQAQPPEESSATGSSSSTPHSGNSFIGSLLLMNPSYTGAMLEKMSTQQAAYFGASPTSGLLVRTVVPNSPAAIAGMQVCDVILRADDKPVVSTSDWAKAIKNSHGRPLTIVVLRDKKEQTLTLTPDSKKRSSVDEPTGPSVAYLGFSWLPHS